MFKPRALGIGPTNLSGLLGVMPANKHPTRRADPVFSINLKCSIATVSVIVGVLAASGPASASTTQGFIESQYVPTLSGVNTSQERGASPGFMDYIDDALLDSGSTSGLKFETEITDYLRRSANGV